MYSDFNKLNAATLDALLEGIQVIDFNWRYIFVNETAVKHSRYSLKKDLLGFTMMEKFPGIEKTELFRTLKNTMLDRQRREIDNEFEYSDKSKACFKLLIEPVPEGIFILSFDITRQKRAEDELRESEERYRLFFSQSIDAIMLTSPDGTVRDANSAALQMFGYTLDELKRIGRKGLVDPEDPNLDKLLREREKEGYYRGELTFIRKDGRKIICDISTKIYTVNGEVRTHLIARDITEQKAQIKAIQLRNIFYNQLLASQPAVFYVVEEGKRANFISPNVTQITGYEIKDFVNPNFWADNIHPEDKERVFLFKSGNTEGDVEYRWKGSQGQWLIFKDHFNVVKNEQGENIIHGTWIDITDVKEKENQIFKHAKGLEHMLFVTSHKIRQPVAHILGINNLIEQEILTADELKNVLRIYKGSASALDDFTKELTDYMHKLKS